MTPLPQTSNERARDQAYLRSLAKLKKYQAALHEIHALLDGTHWGPGTLDDIAGIMRDLGFPIRDPSEMKKARGK